MVGALGSLLLVLTMGCSNSMSARGDAPFKLGKVESALWLQDESSQPLEGYGRASLLLISKELSCSQFMALENDDAVFWAESGIMATFRWSYNAFEDSPEQDAGWEGTYYAGMDVDELWENNMGEVSRWFWGWAFADGAVWSVYDDDGLATIEEYDTEVVGELGTALFEASFKAEDCGKEAAVQDTGR